MKAAVFKGPGIPLAIEDVPDPKPGEGQILLKVASCGICGSDLHITSGHGSITMPAGVILGHEYAGEIVEVGKGVTGFRAGVMVTAMPSSGCGQCDACRIGEVKWCQGRKVMQGGYGEYLLAGADTTFMLPAQMSAEDGALVEPLAVGLHGVAVADMKVGAKVLVIGAGPVGLAAIFWARRFGAGRIAVMASSDRRKALALAMGATDFVVPVEGPSSVEAVNDALGSAPDLVLECVGVPGMIEKSVAHVRPLGTVVVLGFCTEDDPWKPTTGLFKEAKIVFAYVYGKREFELCIDTLDAGHVEPRQMVTDRISLSQLPTAFEDLRARTTQCKVLVDPRLG
jgi:(R,R)-butanediol dehydrogenase/meso-butanediol dehydrogenase/diacetyl reductase